MHDDSDRRVRALWNGSLRLLMRLLVPKACAVPAAPERRSRQVLDGGHSWSRAAASDASAPSPIHVFISYAHADEEPHLRRFEVTLRALRRTHPDLSWWHDRRLTPGTAWETASARRGEPGILDQLNRADIACLLVSPDFMASDYCWSRELPLALRRYADRGGCVLPIIIRHTPGWHQSELGAMQPLPKDAKPVSKWSDPDEFWSSVADGLARSMHLVRTARSTRV